YQKTYMNYRGEFDITASYSVNDVVRVIDGNSYDLPYCNLEAKFTASSGDEGTYNIPTDTIISNTIVAGSTVNTPWFPPDPGTYICVTAVPAYFFLVNVAGSSYFNL